VRTGRIFEIMDSVAGLVSYQHCYAKLENRGRNKMICVTGSIESFFMFEKIDIMKDMQIEGYLNAVGKTSMEIEINLAQEGKLKASSIFTMIARDAENPTKGYQVPSLDFSHLTEAEKSKSLERQADAKDNALRRKEAIENSYDKKPPNQAEIAELHQMFLDRKGNSLSRANSASIGSTVIENCEIMHTQERNVHGKIFGGFLVREMVELGWVAACKFTEDYVIMEDLTNIYFKKPVDVGSRLTLRASITYVEHNRVVITVEAYTAKFTDKK
jgi:acyl-coenzyme A thioesterase 9